MQTSVFWGDVGGVGGVKAKIKLDGAFIAVIDLTFTHLLHQNQTNTKTTWACEPVHSQFARVLYLAYLSKTESYSFLTLDKKGL